MLHKQKKNSVKIPFGKDIQPTFTLKTAFWCITVLVLLNAAWPIMIPATVLWYGNICAIIGLILTVVDVCGAGYVEYIHMKECEQDGMKNENADMEHETYAQ